MCVNQVFQKSSVVATIVLLKRTSPNTYTGLVNLVIPTKSEDEDVEKKRKNYLSKHSNHKEALHTHFGRNKTRCSLISLGIKFKGIAIKF